MYLVFLSLFTHVHIHLFCLSSDPTLTTHNVVEMTKEVDYGSLPWVLSVSGDKWLEIRGQYQSDEQRCEALIVHTLSTHPCMSWKLIAHGLQRQTYREAATEVTMKYVKGQLRTTQHINAGPCTVSSDFFNCCTCMLYIICTPTNACIHVHSHAHIFLYTTAS